jgi:hypothetical protein
MGIDLAKKVIGLDRRGAVVLRHKWSRGQIEARLAPTPRFKEPRQPEMVVADFIQTVDHRHRTAYRQSRAAASFAWDKGSAVPDP